MKCTAKFRYRQKAVGDTVEKAGTDSYRVTFDKPEKAVTLGQIVVLYDNEECLGGGIIKEIIK